MARFPVVLAAVTAIAASRCGGVTAGKHDGSNCRSDSDCASHFCDRTACADIPQTSDLSPNRFYGEACTSNVRASGMTGGPGCGAYTCIDSRCRSCVSDMECGVDSKCYRDPAQPGATCGGLTNPDPTWIPVQWCNSDADCASTTNFCDLGSCVNSVDLSSTYGFGCEADGGATICRGTTIGYPCIAGRCRSCKTDSDCPPGDTCNSGEQQGSICSPPF